ncbi:ABC transporter ATP-binding protein [Amycolatopsis pithecellobii]|uniref:ATP-binding cassette domain-containing protein n=1 Tax=Amycolatopsis pithecellobii TaxID=664692 RepID=A0A6N7YPN6_9PSEU|nr:ABC transporter ATP-binding protein [Amycolatopsis pithecellobii]MTD54965.1 ATP-binding cassette domain-containing protein [Amycolatopsis pithecellobii]
MTTTPAIRTIGLAKQFGGLRAVDDVSLTVPRGSIYGIVGPNGAGKTTFLNLVNGIVRRSGGEIEVLGSRTSTSATHQVARLGVARTFQTIKLIPGLDVVESVVAGRYRVRRDTALAAVLAMPGERKARRESVARAQELLDLVGLRVPPRRLATSLSYGEQRRLEIARALASEPSLLLLDEPTAGMNAQESAALGELLVTLRETGLTLVMVEHNMGLVRTYCTDAAVLNSGALLMSGEPGECLDDPRVQEAYFGRRANA